ncbi:unnamed protein product [Rotaria magnacalcarata]|uniref:Uncharacterized protein n=1 Tax=Rotaria magnacalcarata TaxID=392030 RepID=A0A816TQ53_9BILA|nr:unnamed protein product [Rotaria magnacalcarata]CAF4052422.1 unnamed protein product [Rotaria magnacalcarata]CAF4081146.1 unnamed protein product [Rotaria magnacalcarata]
MSENKITIENLTKEGLVHMIYKQIELIEKQNDLNEIQEENDTTDSSDKKSLDTLLHKISNTIIDITVSSEVDVQLSINSSNDSLTSHKEKRKSSGKCLVRLKPIINLTLKILEKLFQRHCFVFVRNLA